MTALFYVSDTTKLYMHYAMYVRNKNYIQKF